MATGLFYKEILPFTAMVVLELGNVGVNTLFKAATLKGMSYYVFVVYSYLIPALILLPSPFLQRRTVLPPLSSWIIGKLFVLGILGAICLLLAYKGIEYGSPTLASAMSNLIPAFTFILAIIFRMEKLAWTSSSSQAKIIGTIVSISGALLIILYKGPSIMFSPTESSVPYYYKLFQSSNSEWIIGGVLLGTDYILSPVWYILQAHIINEYPAELVVVFFYNLFAALVSGAISSVTEPDRAAWMLKPDLSLVAILYSGIYSLFCTTTHTWILRRKGPFYVAMFKPLSIAIAAAMGVIFLGDPLYLGSIIGAVVISLGFYSLMWGKTTEDTSEDLGFTDPESSSCKKPLL